MGARQEAVVSDMLHAWGGDGRQPDLEKIMAAFAENAKWTLYMPDGPTIVGRDAIRIEIERQLSYFSLISSKILLIASGDSLVAAERRDHFIRRGKEMEMLLAGMFELDADNKITAWRDYFDMADLAQNTGEQAATLSGLEEKAAVAGLEHVRPIPEAATGGALAMALQPPLTPEQQFIEDFCDAWGDGSDTSRPDVDKILAAFAPDAIWHLCVPNGPVIKGHDALRQEILRQMQYATNNKCNTVHAVSNPSVVVQERSDWAVMRGRPCPHQMIAIYELDGQGLIVRWREYINMADLDRKRGVPAAVAHEGVS